MDNLNSFLRKIQREPSDLMFPSLYLIVLLLHIVCNLLPCLGTTWKPFRSLIPSALPVQTHMETHPWVSHYHLDTQDKLPHLLPWGQASPTASVDKGFVLGGEAWSFFQAELTYSTSVPFAPICTPLIPFTGLLNVCLPRETIRPWRIRTVSWTLQSPGGSSTICGTWSKYWTYQVSK